MSWTHVAEAGRAGAMSARTLTPDEQDAVADVLDAAHEWRAGRLPWQAAANIGTYHNPERTRFLAITTTPKTDSRWHDLMALLNVLVDMSGFVRTRQGVYSTRELGEHEIPVHIAPWEAGAA